MKEKKVYVPIIVILCIALGISVYFNTRDKFLPERKAEHLGKLTYNIPTDGKWVYSDFNDGDEIKFPGKAGVATINQNGKILSKAYYNLQDMTELTVGYYDPDFDKLKKEDLSKWNTENEEIPQKIESIKIATDEKEDVSGTYWVAIVQIGGVKYIVRMSQTGGMSSTSLYYGGQEVIHSMDIDESLSDEYKKIK